MEDDDDFGDLYSDVLPNFPPPPSNSHQSASDPNLQLKKQEPDEDDDFAAPFSNSDVPNVTHVTPPGLELNLSKGGENRYLGNTDNANFDEESFRFDLEEEVQGDGDVGLGPVIPGLSTTGLGREEAGADDWDSDDSEDDLQIVLNETAQDPMVIEMGGELDDGQIDGVDGHGVEEQGWGEDGGEGADREKKDGGEGVKLNQGMVVAPRPPGYVGHGYHAFHSQFKYVRPGAAPLQGAPAAGPVGAPGQLRPIGNLGPMAGRGRGDWRPPGQVRPIVPGMQKGFGAPGWANSGGRGLGIGLDFTLPSHKTIFEVDIDGFEEKPWNNPGVDVTDFFNFGLTEEGWKGYCKQLEQFRLASTMQSRIHVYESGRSEQAYDPDIPPELTAAAAGVSDHATKNVNFQRADVEHIDVAKSLAPAKPLMPTGRQIQVETGSGERLPSMDTRPPRTRELDAIIEIVCDAFAEGQSSEDDAPQSSEHDEPSNTRHTENQDSEGVHEQSKRGADHSSEERRLSSPVKVHHHSKPSGSREHSPGRSSGSEERRRRRLEGESPHLILQDNNTPDDQSDGSENHIDGKSTELVSPSDVKDGHELNAEHMDEDDEDLSSAIKTDALEDDIKHDKMSPAKNQGLVSPNSKVASYSDLSSGQEYVEDLKAARTGGNNKPIPETSKGYIKSHDVGVEVRHARREESMRSSKRHLNDDKHNVRKRNHEERPDMERFGDAVKGREDPSVHRDGGLDKPSYEKYESSDKRKERGSLEGVWPRKDEDPHNKRGRTNDFRKQDPRFPEHRDEMGSRYSSKAWDGDRIERENHLYSRMQIDTGIRRGPHDMDVSLRQREREESLNVRYKNIDNYRRRRNEENPKRDFSDKEAVLLSRNESPSLRKRENEDHLDPRRRVDQGRFRENIKDSHSVRLKDEVRMEMEKSERPNEGDDRHRTKPYREGSMARRERYDVREPLRSERTVEEKWAGDAIEKDKYNNAVRYAESKRRDRGDDVHILNQRGHDDKYAQSLTGSILVSNSRNEGPISHTNHNTSSNYKIPDEKPKERARKKEHDSRSQNSQTISKRAKNDHNTHRSDKAGTKDSSGQGNDDHQAETHPGTIRKREEEPATDNDEQQQSKKGRSKMERWTSHKERDFTSIVKATSSSRVKERIGNSINLESSVSAELAVADTPIKPVESIDPKASAEDSVPQEVDIKIDNTKEVEQKNNDPVQNADQHLETVAKLKKRSERFKVPLPSEKEAINKKKETEAVLPAQTETPPADPEVKSERPPRKRRWISS